MNFNDLLYYLERTKKPKKARIKKMKSYNRGELTEEEIMKYRQMVNDENYISQAIGNMAGILTERLHVEG